MAQEKRSYADREIALRFWRNVDFGEGCWQWKGGTFGGRYGQFRIGDLKLRAHRISYVWFFGSIPVGAFVCHHCDNGLCVNPLHLYAGDGKTNARDREERTIFRHGPAPGKGLLGERNPAAKLTESGAYCVRRLHKEGWSYRRISVAFAMSKSQIANIVKGRSWAQQR